MLEFANRQSRSPENVDSVEDVVESDRETQELNPRIEALLSVAVREHPELLGIILELRAPRDMVDVSGYYDFVEDEKGDPSPRVYMAEGDPKQLLPKMMALRGSVELIAGMLNMTSREITPELLQLFIFAHELGHIKDYKVNFESDPSLVGWDAVDEMAYQREAVLMMLPVRGVSPGDLVHELNGITDIEEVVAMYPEVKSYPKFGEFRSVDDLIRVQEWEYRAAPPERYADEFAVYLLTEHAEEIGISDVVGRVG